jgi:hypothetical protein
MNKSINSDLLEIVEKKVLLSTMTYDHKNYDDVEEELHDLEDDFLDEHGDFFEDIISDVHEKIKSDSDVLLPIAYLGSRYSKAEKNKDGSVRYEAEFGEGVVIETELYPKDETRLVLIPNPLRMELLVGKSKKQIVWEAK